MNKQENDNQIKLDDLPVDEARQDEVKGGFTPDGRQLVISIKDGPAAGL